VRTTLSPSERRNPSVLIIGTGFGGLSAAMMLKKDGVTSFRIVDRNEGVGGTWWANRYPGAEVDVPSNLYSWRHKRYDWSRTHARQPELQKYIEEVVEENGLIPHLTLGVSVDSLIWNEGRQQYAVELSDGDKFHADYVISAVGLLSKPRFPTWPGLDLFEGPKLHTACWDESVDLKGKKVAVVGVGSSATQIVATIAPLVDKLYVFQREPGWVLPKGDKDFTEAERQAFRNQSEIQRRYARLKTYWQINKGMIRGRNHKPDNKVSRRAEDMGKAYIAQVFKDRPDLAEAVTPKFSFGGKRTVLNGDFYPALLRDNVELVPHAVEQLTASEIVDVTGTKTEVDVIVLATGFEPGNAMAPINVVGRSGKTLTDTWGDEPRALLGIAVPDFPNLFLMYGPGTHGGLIFSNHYTQARWACLAIRSRRRWGKTTFEARPGVMAWYARWYDKQMQGTSYLQTDSYFKNARGVVLTPWPVDAITYVVMGLVLGTVGNRRRKSRKLSR
jgi:cation diffusion facilitator CzcD-associated flavoprotein CzcO